MQFSLASSLSLLFLLPLAAAASVQQPTPDSPALPVDKLGYVEIESRLTISNATQVMNFVAVKHAVFASMRHRTKTSPDAEPERRPILVAWKTDGTLLWTSEQPEAYQLAVARDHVVLAYDAGYRDSERGLIWIDAETGREARRLLLPGRPMLMKFLPEIDLLVVFVMSAGRLRALSDHDDCWLGALAYSIDGKLVWEWKQKCFELSPLRVGAETLVMATSMGTNRAVIGVSSRTGKEVWNKAWDYDGEIASPTWDRNLDSLRTLAVVPCKKGARFFDTATGEQKGAFPLPFQGPWRLWSTEQEDRLFVTPNALDGVTIAAYELPSGKPAWSDETGTEGSYRGPVAWGDETVFLARRLTGGHWGQVSLAELRIYSPRGSLVAHMPTLPLKREFYWNDTLSPQLAYGRLYVASDNAVVLLRRK